MNYNIQFEEPIDFFGELKKSSNDEESLDEDNLCLISFMPLEPNYVQLVCGHKFNYKPIFDEIYNQKNVLNKYASVLNYKKDEYRNFLETHWFYIKCPYCRRLQSECLPYRPEIVDKKIYGINTDDLSLNTDYSFYNYKHPMNHKITDINQCDFCSDADKYKKYIGKRYISVDCNDGPFLHNYFTHKTYCHAHQLIMLNTLKKMHSKGIGFIPQFCQVILKAGKNKGSPCGLDANNGFCKRHQPN